MIRRIFLPALPVVGVFFVMTDLNAKLGTSRVPLEKQPAMILLYLEVERRLNESTAAV